jgi:hypothetical protein
VTEPRWTLCSGCGRGHFCSDWTGGEHDALGVERLRAALIGYHKGAAAERAAIVSWICDQFPGCDFVGHRIEDGEHLKPGGEP